MSVTLAVGTGSSAMAIVAQDRDRWQAALERWQTRLAHQDDSLGPFRPVQLHNAACRSYDVRSYSEPGKRHLVELFLTPDALYARCDCTAGQMSVPCQHVAGAIDDAGWWPFSLDRQLVIEIPQDPPSRYRRGDLVRVARTRHTIYSIIGMRYDTNRGWRYQLQSLDRGVIRSDEPSEDELVLHVNRRRRVA